MANLGNLSIRTNTGNMESTASELKTKVGAMQDEYINMQKAYNTLTSYWSGEAQESFCTTYKRDVQQVLEFINEAEKYVKNMQLAATSYSDAEEASLRANTRA